MKRQRPDDRFIISEFHATVDGVRRVHFFMIDIVAENVIGMVSLELNLPATAKAIDLFVKHDYRHQGYGAALLEAAHVWAIENHCPYFWFTAQSSNERLVAWYIRLGYRPILRDNSNTYFVPREES